MELSQIGWENFVNINRIKMTIIKYISIKFQRPFEEIKINKKENWNWKNSIYIFNVIKLIFFSFFNFSYAREMKKKKINKLISYKTMSKERRKRKIDMIGQKKKLRL